MPQVPLRAYNQEIDSLIDSGQTEVAIAHCLYILRQYPKHLDTYRLLGKAFMENRRYDEAANILNRVLASVPDDFISQIGMSIVREEQGNLDAAIYHMERAFEIQPANMAVQDELRRLYGVKFGREPGKVRLTRGALVRMYVRGELYDQAVAEIEAAQKESDELVDLDILLARINYLTGRKSEAAEISRQIVEQLPYCFEANRILSEVLTEERDVDAATFRERVYAMEPHLRGKNGAGSEAAEIMVERFDEQQASHEQIASWVSNFGSDWSAEEQPGEPGGEQEANEAVLPDWMQEAGWRITGEEETERETEPEAAAGEGMPEWVSGLQPAGEESAAIVGPEEAEQQVEAELRPDESVSVALEGLPGERMPEDSPSSGFEEQGVEADISGTSPADELPDLADADFDLSEDEDLPDWLRELAETPVGEGPGETPAAVDQDLPDELTLEAEVPGGSSSETGPAEIAAPATGEADREDGNIPAWLRQALAEEDSPGSTAEDSEQAGRAPQEWPAEWQSEGWQPPEDQAQPASKEIEINHEIAGDLAWLRDDNADVDTSDPGAELLEQASAELSGGEFARAGELFKRLPEDEQLISGAVAEVRKAVELNPDEPQLWQMLGELLVRNNQLDEALQAYHRADELLK